MAVKYAESTESPHWYRDKVDPLDSAYNIDILRCQGDALDRFSNRVVTKGFFSKQCGHTRSSYGEGQSSV